MNRHKYLIYILLVVFSACSDYQKLLKSSDSAYKYQRAVEYFNKEDYFRALQLFDELITIYKGTNKAEDIYYYYAYCYYKQQNYIIASYHFKNFVMTFPNSDKAEECMFLSAYCKYLDSPEYTLEQINTYDAIKELQMFINKYPESERMAECNQLIDKLRFKLETKKFEVSKMYFDMENYKAAIYSFNNMIKDFPDTQYKEKVYFYILRSNYLFAINSIKDKQKERFNSTVEAYNKFIAYYPSSKFIKEANSIYNTSEKKLND